MPMEITRSGAPHFLCRGSPQARITQLGHRLGSSASLQVQVQQLYTGKSLSCKVGHPFICAGFSGLALWSELAQTTGYPLITEIQQVR
jgi:hypothetical protein